MEIVAISEENADLCLQWQNLVASRPTTGFMQSLEWAMFKRKQGLATLHLGLLEGQKLVGGALFYSAREARGTGYLVAPQGPVLNWNSPEQASCGLTMLLSEAERQAPLYSSMGIRIEPRLPAEPLCRSLSSLIGRKDLARSPVDLLPRETLCLDLQMTEDELLSSMRPKGRYNIRLAERRGVTFRFAEANSADLRLFYSVLKEASLRDGFFLEPLSFFHQLIETLLPSGMARILFAEHEGDCLATMILVSCGHTATYLYGGTSNHKRNLMGGYALQWAAIKAARQIGCLEYDFYGFDQFMSPGNAYSKFSQFKRKFGGEVKRFVGAYDRLIIQSLADAIIRAVNESVHCQVDPLGQEANLKCR